MENSGRIQKGGSDTAPSDRPSIIGKIKIGRKTEQGYPESVDYFIPTGPYAPIFKEKCGDKPNTITVVFPNNHPESVCNQRIEGRDGSGSLVFASDGKNHKLFNCESNSFEPATTKELEAAKKNGVKIFTGYGKNRKSSKVTIEHISELLTLTFIVVDISGIMGCWQLSTKGAASSIPNVINAFDQMAAQAGDKISFVPFDLHVEFAKSQKPGSHSKFPVLTLTANMSYESGLKLSEFKDAPIVFSKLLSDENINDVLSLESAQPKFLQPAQEEEIPEADVVEETGKTIKEKLIAFVSEWSAKYPVLIRNNKEQIEKIEQVLFVITKDELKHKRFLKLICACEVIEDLTIGAVHALCIWCKIEYTDDDMTIPADMKRVKEFEEIVKYPDII